MNQGDKDAFARRLRQVLEAKGMKHVEAARIMDVSGEMMRRYTASPCLGIPNHERIRTFAVATGISPSWLAYGEGDMIPDERARSIKIPLYSALEYPATEESERSVLTEVPATLALELTDDAMRLSFAGTTTVGGKGSTVLIDENTRPAPGELAAATNGSSTVVRIYSPQNADGSMFSLLSNTSVFPPIRNDDGYNIIGKVVEIRSPQ